MLPRSSFAEEIVFKQITSAEGISQSEVYCFLHDSKGYMWFGTLDGLNKFDGYSITKYNINKNLPNSLSHNTIYSLAEDKFGRIWIGTGNGINLFDPLSQELYSLPDFYFGKQLIVMSLLAEENNLWIGTDNGLFRLPILIEELSQETLKQVADSIEHVSLRIGDKVISNCSVNKIEKGSDACIWVGTWEGISCFEFSAKHENQFYIPDLPEELKKISEITSITTDNTRNLWIGTQNSGLYRYKVEEKEIKNFTSDNSRGLLSNSIKSLTTDLAGNIWIGNFKDGLNKIDFGHETENMIEFSIYQNNEFQPGSLNSNLIRSLYVSRDGMLWIGTLGKGINIYDPNQKLFRIIRIPPLDKSGRVNNFVRSVFQDQKENLWMGMHLDGLIKFDRINNEYKRMELERQTIFHIFPARNDFLWLASSSGTHLVKPTENKIEIVTTLDFEQLTNVVAYNASFFVEQSSENIYWIASMSGIMRVNLLPDFSVETKTFNINTNPALSLNNTRILEYDKANNILWAGTEGGGLNEIQLNEEHFPKEIIHHKFKPGNTEKLSSNYVRSLHLDEKNQLWIGTYEGLNLCNRDSETGSLNFRSWKKEDGLPNNMIQSIQEDENANLWIGTNGGLTRFDPEQELFTNYKISDGLQSNEFSEHATFKAPGGELIFGGIDGVNIFYPEQIQSNPISPSVVITDFYLFNKKVEISSRFNKHIILEKPVDITDSLSLKANENDLRFDFSALFYADPGKIQYEYILSGYDEDWISTDAFQRSAIYTNLNFGKYVFKVRATNNDGVWSENTASIFIHIQTPFWLKWWAIMMYLLSFILIVIYFANFSIIKITTKKQLILDNEHNERLRELENLRIRFFINMSHDLRTPLTLITQPLENILKNFNIKSELKNQLLTINRSAKRLKYRVEQLLDIRKFETGNLEPKLKAVEIVEFIRNEVAHFELAFRNKGLNIIFNSSEKRIETLIDNEILEKVLFNLLSNALKHTKKGGISIIINRKAANSLNHLPLKPGNNFYLMIEVQDSGLGMTKEKTKIIFERFYQDPEDSGKGYGIGLSHTRDLLEAHDGHIEVFSKKGKGTNFVFYIPLTSSVIKEEPLVDVIVERENQIQLQDSALESTQIEKQSEFSETKSVLLAEDNNDLRTYMKSILEKNYKIFEAVDGEEGLSIAMVESPDIIVSDIMMPKMNGIEFCSQIKSNIETSHIPVILLTAKVDAETRFKSIETGADDYIPKPFEIEYLCLRIKNILQSREHLRDLFQKNILLEPSTVTVTSTDEIFLKKLMETIEEGIPDSEFSIQSMEEILGMSHTNFYRKIKQLTGQSGKELLQNMRLQRAKQLISQKKLRISEVAYMTGFTNPKYFSNCFKQKYGMSPSEYKE